VTVGIPPKQPEFSPYLGLNQYGAERGQRRRCDLDAKFEHSEKCAADEMLV
jgi:hypothetical protein